MRNILVDCQILQTAAYDRGMGKYTLSLLEALISINNKQKHHRSITILFNSNLDKSKTRISAIKALLPSASVVYLDLPIDINQKTEKKYEEAQDTITEYIAKSFKGDGQIDYLISAPFFVSFAAVFPTNPGVAKYTIVYDLIPYKLWHLQRIFDDYLYAQHFKLFLDADHLFTISKAVKDDLVKLIGLDDRKITHIDGGPFMRESVANASKQDSYDKPYVLFISAPIIHKNNTRAAQAFAKFNAINNGRYTLYITSTFDDDTKKKLQSYSDKIIFTGNISDSELAQAYSDASVVFFPSLIEGLGMPVLEAVRYGVPVACSDIPILSELSTHGFYQFDPNSVGQMSTALDQAAKRVGWNTHQADYNKIKQTYTWHKSASLVIKEMATSKETAPKQKQSLQITSPSPNTNSAAAVMCELIYAPLSELFKVSLSSIGKKTPTRSSYVAYMSEQRDSKTNLKLKIESRRWESLFTNKNWAKVTLTLHNEKIKSVLKIKARPVVWDKALQLKGWQYADNSNNILSQRDIATMLFDKQKAKK